MKPRERVALALNHREADRCPMQISFTPEFAERLKSDLQMTDRVLNLSSDRALSLSVGGAHNPHGAGNTYELERALGVDLLQISVGWANSYYQAGGEYTDEWGVGWRSMPYDTPFGPGSYTEMVHHPLAAAGSLSCYHAPNPASARAI